MKLFVDSANVEEIQEAVARGCSGVTTNPSLLAREGGEPMAMLKAIVTTIGRYGLPLNVELWEEQMLEQAGRVRTELFRYEGLVFKIPIGWTELRVVRSLAWAARKTNVTACMTTNQALLAAGAGATYVSLFWNRIRDGGESPYKVVHRTRNIFDRDGIKTEIIVGSIRAPHNVEDAFTAGAHIVTVPPPILRLMTQHPETDKVVAQFARDAGVLA